MEAKVLNGFQKQMKKAQKQNEAKSIHAFFYYSIRALSIHASVGIFNKMSKDRRGI